MVVRKMIDEKKYMVLIPKKGLANNKKKMPFTIPFIVKFLSVMGKETILMTCHLNATLHVTLYQASRFIKRHLLISSKKNGNSPCDGLFCITKLKIRNTENAMVNAIVG